MGSYTVRQGDTLWGIAQRTLGNGSRWGELGYQGDPKKLRVGTVLNWGGSPAPSAPPAPSQPSQPSGPSFAEKQAKEQQDYQNRLKAEREALERRQRQEEEGLFGQFSDVRGKQERLGSAYDRFAGEAGLGELKKTSGIIKGEVYKVKDMIDRLEEDVNERTSGQFVSEAQRRRQLAAEGNPLTTNLSRLTNSLQPVTDSINATTEDIGRRLGFLSQDQEREVEPIKMRLSAMSDRFSREMTGFSQDKQSELTMLLDKLQSERALENREWEQVQKLAAEEREFSRQKELMDKEFEQSMQLKKAEGASKAGAGTGTAMSELMKLLGKGEETKAETKSNDTGWRIPMAFGLPQVAPQNTGVAKIVNNALGIGK